MTHDYITWPLQGDWGAHSFQGGIESYLPGGGGAAECMVVVAVRLCRKGVGGGERVWSYTPTSSCCLAGRHHPTLLTRAGATHRCVVGSVQGGRRDVHMSLEVDS